MTQITTQILNVQDRVATNRQTGNQFTIHEVFTTAQPEPFQARADLVQIARNLIGQTVEMVVRSEQRGQWTNHFVDFISMVGGGIAQPQPQAQYAPASTGAAAVTTNPPDHRAVERRSIHRQVATKVAQAMSDNPGEFWTNVNALMAFYETGRTPMTDNPGWTMAQAQAAAAQNAAQYGEDPGPQAGQYDSYGDDLPF